MTIPRLTPDNITLHQRVSFIARTLREVRRRDLAHGTITVLAGIYARVLFDHDVKRFKDQAKDQLVRVQDLIPELK